MIARPGGAAALCWTAGILMFAASAAAQESSSAPRTSREAAAARVDSAGELSVGPGDLLSIEVVGLDQLARKVRVAEDGTITLPLVGAVDVGGLSPRGVEDQVAASLRNANLVNDAQVAVVVEEYVSQGIALMGAVAKPGTYQVAGGKTLFDVLLEAGGVTGGAREIVVIRQRGPDQSERMQVDAVKLLTEGDLTYDITLQAGDIVMVPESSQFKVLLNGSVAQQGPIEFSAGEKVTLLQAIVAAGGASERAKLGKVKILRRQRDGSFQVNIVDLKKVSNGRAPDFVLEPNDIVIVGERFF